MHLFSISASLILVVLSTYAANLDIISGCKDLSLSGTVLSATCQRGDGTYDSMSIDLDQCIVNVNGYLQCTANG